MALKRGRTRQFGEVGEDLDDVVEAVLGVCAREETQDAGALRQRIEALTEEVEGMGEDEATRLREKRYLRKLRGCVQALRLVQAEAACVGPKNPLVDRGVQTSADSTVLTTPSEHRLSNPATPKKPRMELPPLNPAPAPSASAAVPLSPQQSPMAAPVAASFSLGVTPLDASLDLSEADMVRIAAELIFSIMRVARGDGEKVRTLNELFIEADCDADEGISFTELLTWVKDTLQVRVSDWQLDGFGKVLHWEKECQAHPKRYIDAKAFLKIIRDVWAKVRWYFHNAVVYGVVQSSDANGMPRTNAVLDAMDRIREAMEGVIEYLVVQNCHIHTFFAQFDTERKQAISSSDLAGILWLLKDTTRVASEESARSVADECCSVAHALFPPPPKEAGGGGAEAGGENEDEAASISLFQLQDLVREFFTEFRRRLEYGVLEDEARAKFVVRKFFFKLVGVTDSEKIAPITNTFTLISKYSDGTGRLDPARLRALLKHEFDVALTDSELRDVVTTVDADRDFVLDSAEFTAFVDVAHAEIKQQVTARMPSDFQAGLGYAMNLSPACVHVFAQLILRILHTKETFAEFFKNLPRFAPPNAFTMMSGNGRWPDEVVLGLRRVGIHSTPEMFLGWGGPALEGWTGFNWGPTRSVLDQEHFLAAIWNVWSQFIEPAFQLARNWESEAAHVAAQCLEATVTHFGIAPVPAGPEVLQLVWDRLPKTADGGGVPAPAFCEVVAAALQKQHTDKIASRATLTSPAVLKSTVGEEGLLEMEVKQLLNLASVTTALSKEQLASVLWRGR